jgi:hypothetical protein
LERIGEMLSAITRGFVNATIGLSVILGCLLGVVITPRTYQPVGTLPLLLAIGVVVAGTLVCVRLRRLESSADRVAVAVLAAMLVTRLVYVAAAGQPLFSDFATMWNYAVLAAHSGSPVPARFLMEVRTFPYLLPLAIISGGSPSSYKIANVVLIVLSAGIVYLYTRRLGGPPAALIALVIVALAPEPLLAPAVATHDVPGTFLTLLALYLMAVMDRVTDETPKAAHHWLKLAGWGAVLGIILVLGEIQRGLGIFLVATILFGSVIQALHRPGAAALARTVVCGLILPYAVLKVGNAAFMSRVPKETVHWMQRSSWRWIAAYANSESDGAYGNLTAIVPSLDLLEDRDLQAFAVARTMTDFADRPAARPANFVRRSASLYKLGAQFWFYLDDSQFGRRWNATALVPTPAAAAALSRFFRAYTAAFRVPFLLAGLIALIWTLLRQTPTGILLRPVLFIALLTLSLALLGESQPRYLFALWFILPIYIGLWAMRMPPAEPAEMGARLREVAVVAALGGAAVLAGWVGARKWRDAGHGFVSIAVFHATVPLVPDGRYAFHVEGASDSIAARVSSASLPVPRMLDVFITGDTASGCATTVAVRSGEVGWVGNVGGPGVGPARAHLSGILAHDGQIPIGIQTSPAASDRCRLSVSFPWIR